MSDEHSGNLFFEARWLDADGKAKGAAMYFTREFFESAMLPGLAVEHGLRRMAETAVAGFLDIGEEDAKALLQEKPQPQAEEGEGELCQTRTTTTK